MKKEVLIAIFIGFSLGLLITFGIRTARESLKARDNNASLESSLLPTPSPTTLSHQLLITAPKDAQIIFEPETSINGATTPLSLISILTADRFETTIADMQGSFSATIPLKAGANQIEIVSFNPQNERSSAQITVVYTTNPEQLTGGEPNE
jgi:hypothetical protein